MNTTNPTNIKPLPEQAGLTELRELQSSPAWQEIQAGRYMPRRTRGSLPGRELG